jgi:lysophospholipase L1-like esterase
LQKKLNREKATEKIAILNQAAGGNRILHDSLGPNAFSRIDRDVLAQPGVKYAMIFEGVNDIGVAGPDVSSQAEIGDQLIMAFQQIAARIQAVGILFGGATITPFGTPASSNYTQPYSDSEREKTRQKVNSFIRNSGIFDFVLDFDHVLHDPQNQSVLLGKFDSGDHLHPNEAGYQAIADYFPSDSKVFCSDQSCV